LANGDIAEAEIAANLQADHVCHGVAVFHLNALTSIILGRSSTVNRSIPCSHITSFA
jgi:hypothetical protein